MISLSEIVDEMSCRTVQIYQSSPETVQPFKQVDAAISKVWNQKKKKKCNEFLQVP